MKCLGGLSLLPASMSTAYGVGKCQTTTDRQRPSNVYPTYNTVRHGRRSDETHVHILYDVPKRSCAAVSSVYTSFETYVDNTIIYTCTVHVCMGVFFSPIVLLIIVDEIQTVGNEKINAPRCSTRFNVYSHTCTYRVLVGGDRYAAHTYTFTCGTRKVVV